jgi:GntR family phosphonate transport system transcriptional regulator
MGRAALWTSIRDTLVGEIAAGRYPAGAQLPTEARLAARFDVNRHTVRRALADLAETGFVHPRRGAGVFVTHKPTDYPLGRRVRFRQNIEAAGRVPGRKALLLETRRADPREAGALALTPGASVHVYEGLTMADGDPIALFRSVFPADRFPNMLQALDEDPSITAAFEAHGLNDYVRSSTRISAESASSPLAHHLRIPTSTPVLHSVSVNSDTEGHPIEFGRSWFAGDRVTLTISDSPAPQ